MSKNQVERTEGSHVITAKAQFDSTIPKGTAIVFIGDYLVDNLPDQNTFAQGVTLQAHASGVYECIPVLLPGPVLNVLCGEAGGVVGGNLVNGDAAVPGEWIIDTSDPAGFVLIAGDDGDNIDICFVGDQN